MLMYFWNFRLQYANRYVQIPKSNYLFSFLESFACTNFLIACTNFHGYKFSLVVKMKFRGDCKSKCWSKKRVESFANAKMLHDFFWQQMLHTLFAVNIILICIYQSLFNSITEQKVLFFTTTTYGAFRKTHNAKNICLNHAPYKTQ